MKQSFNIIYGINPNVKKKLVLVFSLFMLSLLHSQNNTTQLPYSKKVKYNKKSEGNVIAKMVDDLGYKYYSVTDSLLNEELNTNFYSNKLPRLLIEGAYQMSDNINNSTSDIVKQSELKNEEISFEDIRKNTLLNLKNASSNLINNKEALLFLNWNDFIKSIAHVDAFCNQIILFREDIGNPSKLKNDSRKQRQSKSKYFDESRGADGLTNQDWKAFMMRGGGTNGHDIIRYVNRWNQGTFVELKKQELAAIKKQERASIEVGNLKTIKITSRSVDGLTYTYSNYPPKQLSFLYSNDSRLIEGINNWILYINSGNSVKLSEMFRVGLDVIISIDDIENQSLVNNSYRDVIDNNENKIQLMFSEKHFDEINFSNIKISKVLIRSTEIQFYAEADSPNDLSQKEKEIVIVLKNVEGDLLDRIKVNITQTREGLNEYDDTIMNLSKY